MSVAPQKCEWCVNIPHKTANTLPDFCLDSKTELVYNGRFFDADLQPVIDEITEEMDKVARAIWNGTLSGPAFLHLLTAPRLLDAAEQLCGPELIASSVYRLRPKIPNYNYGAVP